VSIRRFRLAGSQSVFREHYIDDGNAPVSSVDPELFGKVSVAPEFAVPDQYRSDPIMEFLSERLSFVNNRMIRLGISIVFGIRVDDQ
jgi:hypothetical protein